MKAVQLNTYGLENLKLVDIQAPAPQKEHVLVEVHAAGLNPFDAKVLSGAYQKMMPLTFPVTFGGDFAGVVKHSGEGVTDYKVGDEIYGTAIVFSGGSGGYAEFATAVLGKIAHKPKNTTFEEAAALPVAGISAMQAIAEHIRLQPGQKILIHGGAGGIGHMAIQLAKKVGAYVATTVSGDDKDFVKELGADLTVDYKTEKFEEKVHGYDAVFTTVGGEIIHKSYHCLKKGGILVSMVGVEDAEHAKEHGITAMAQNTKTDHEHLKHLAEIVENGGLKVHIDRTFSLEEVQTAFTHLNTAHPRGKVVLTLK